MAISRRAALLFAMQIGLDQQDDWAAFRDVWNPFAEKLNKGVFDNKLWQKVRREFHRLEGVKDGCK